MNNEAQTLEKILSEEDGRKCEEFLLNCSEQERLGLRGFVKVLRSAITITTSAKKCRLIGMSTLACGTLEQMKALPERCDPLKRSEMTLDFFRFLKIPWLGDWVEYLSQNRAQSDYFFLINDGLCPAPDRDAERFITNLLDKSYRRDFAICEAQTSFMKKHVWKVFEIEGNADQSLASYDKEIRSGEHSWAYFLKKASEEGKFDRTCLLDASLDALSRDFAPIRVGWFSAFHEYLAPTTAELVERTDRYLKLLSSNSPVTVSFALKGLKVIDKERPL